jgi:uncharacterized phiE125 gp8 family phage protein
MNPDTYGLKISTGPSAAVVATSTAKTWMRISHSDEDSLIASLITRATNYVENETRRQLINATYTFSFDMFPHGDVIYSPVSPLGSVTSITYLDADGASQTLASSVYGVDIIRDPGRIYLKSGQEWPSTLDQDQAVTITAVAGYGASSSDVPEPLIQAVLMLAAHFYEHREAVDPKGTTFAPVPMGVERLILQYRVAEAF